MCGCAIAVFKFVGSDSFEMTEKSEITIAFTTGKRVMAERSKVCFMTKNGGLIQTRTIKNVKYPVKDEKGKAKGNYYVHYARLHD